MYATSGTLPATSVRMADTSTKGKVEALIARALSTTHVEEARTSALIAVRLIREAGLLSGVSSGPTYNDGFAAGRSQGVRDAAHDIDSAYMRGFNAGASSVKVEPQAAPKSEAKPRKPVSGARKGSGWRAVFEAKYAGHCGYCDAAINVGERMSWAKGKPSFHEACYAEYKQKTAA